jgi:hypothetical protein
MTVAIAAAALFALVAGGISGFSNRWRESLILSGLVAPLICAAIAAVYARLVSMNSIL